MCIHSTFSNCLSDNCTFHDQMWITPALISTDGAAGLALWVKISFNIKSHICHFFENLMLR